VYLRGLAARLGDAHVATCGADAVLLVGSAAEGISDEWSDIDLVLFYDNFPSLESLHEAVARFAPTASVPLGGDVEHGVLLEQHTIDGVACQLVHQTFDAWRAQAATVLEQLETESPAQKALQGLHDGVVLHGDDRIAALRAGAAYPDALRTAMVAQNITIFPLWRLQGSLRSRDADLWQRAEIVSGLQRLLGALAGLNRKWFSTFQLKKLGRLCDSFEDAPVDLAARVHATLSAPTAEAVLLLRELVADTAAVIERQMPDVDTGPLRRLLGAPMEPWTLPG
jgi:hypothetical protein